MKRARRPALAVLLVAALGACGTSTHSSYLETAGFYVIYAVVRELDGTLRAVAVYQERGASGLALVLDDGDSASVDDQPLTRVDSAGAEPGFSSDLVVSYEGGVDAGLTHHFTLTRSGEDPVVKDVDDPAVFSPVFSDGGTDLTASPGTVVTLTWTAVSGATITAAETVTSGSACLTQTLASGLSDTGTISFAPTTLSTDGGACVLTLQLVRTDDTAIGSPFHGGYLRTVAVSQTSVTLQ
jgi:hypothetical protein